MILGSASPRRKEILSFFNLPFSVSCPTFDEEAHPFRGDPVSYAKEISASKALSLSHLFPNEILITADTVVYKEGKIYLKPLSLEESIKTLKELSGSEHSVYTAVTVRKGPREETDCEESRVVFHKINDAQIRKYCEGIHVQDKAGGYAIQGKGALIVKELKGCYYNVMGLPINTLQKLLLIFGIDLWDHLK